MSTALMNDTQGKLFRDTFRKHLRRMSDEDRVAVAELLQDFNCAADIDVQREILVALDELLFPEDFYGSIADVGEDPKARERVDLYRAKVGQAVRKHRQASHMTQAALAEKSQTNQSHISKIEKGRHAPSYITIERIAAALGVRPIDLDPGFED